MHTRSLSVALSVALLTSGAYGKLTFESVQLTDKDVATFPAISFAKGDNKTSEAECRAFPGSANWPSVPDWDNFNASIGGALLYPVIPAAACYPGPDQDAIKCDFLVRNASTSHFYIDDPLTALTQWPQGNTCLPALNTTGNCTRGGFPEYVVNATTVKHVQAAVNFARNKNIRLIIKNKGHDFGGRSLGAGSLSIWVHHLDEFEYLPRFKKVKYNGPAARYGAGLEQFELFNNMARYNITMVGSGVRTISANGGWFAHGGHGHLTSLYGLGSDQALELGVVTADGKYIVADEEENADLFYALRGGGPSTYGVVVSVVVKAYPPTTLSSSSLSIACNPPADTNPRAPFAPVSTATNFVNNTDRFWEAINIYFRYKETIVNNSGVDWDYLYPLGNGSFSFRVRVTYPNTTAERAAELLQPLYDNYAKAGFNFLPFSRNETIPTPYASRISPPPSSNGLAAFRYRSRLLPHANWASDNLFNKTMAAIRESVEVGGYTFHGLALGPSPRAAGWPGRGSSVNPAWRHAVLHACLMTQQGVGLTAQAARDEEARIQGYLSRWRELTPGAGAYLNEGDPGEPDWQQAFYGSNYGELLRIKKERDPWGVFWATTTVGSEAWEVRAVDGYPRSQNGRLCRTGKTRVVEGRRQ